MTIRTLSAHQSAIMDAIRATRENIEIEAAAGAGKTSTLEYAIKHVLDAKAFPLYVVFNKRNADEAAERLGDTNAATMTLNALGWRTLLAGCRKGKRLNLQPDKLWNIIRDTLSKPENKLYGKTVHHLVMLARSEGLGAKVYNPATRKIELFDSSDDASWMEVIERYEVSCDDGEQNVYDAIELARKVLGESIRAAVEDGVLDFADQNYMIAHGGMPVKWGEWTHVLVDEAQDLNAVQAEMVAQLVSARKARVIFVGDPWQAIYGFRGALNDSMSTLAARFSCKVLPLSVCWRCDASMIELARTTGAPIEVAPGKAQGRTETVSRYNTAPGDVVLCRTTAPLISAAYRMIAQGKSAVVLGRDIGAGLCALVKKLRAKSVNELEQKMSAWLRDQISEAEESGKPGKAAAAEDKIECLQVLVDQLTGADRTIPALLATIDSLFSDKALDRAVTFSTIHKAKGREWDKVIILDRHRMPIKWASAPWMQKQEVHCMYVAYTRARHELLFVTADGLNATGGDAANDSGDMQLMA